MADYDFPPLLQGEGPTLDAASILQAQNAGEWSRTFGEHGAGTGPGKNNLMTRKRHNANIARETEANQQLQEQHQLNELKTNKGALDLYVRGKKLDMDLKLGRANLDRIAQQVDAKEQMLPLEMEAKKAATNAALAREKSTIAATAMKAELERQKDEHTEGFVAHMKATGAVRGTKAFEDEAVNARMKFSGMDHVLYQDVVKNHGSGTDPDEALKLRQTALTAAPNATVTTRLPGGVTVTDRAGTDETKALQSRYDKFVLQRAKTTDKNVKTFLDAEIAEMKGKMGGFEKGLVAPAAPVADANKAALDWVAANPNDPRAAAIKAKLGVK